METVDRGRPQAVSHRDPTRKYQPGIGPFSEDQAVALTVGEMQVRRPTDFASLAKCRYPNAAKTCDLALGSPPAWVLEVKLARVGRDNGTYEDTAVKKILSPYADDRSAVTDCVKLVESGFTARKAVLIYGFEDPKRPLMWLIEAFELIARQHVKLGEREETELRDLVHPIFASGSVFAWELHGLAST